MHMAHRLLAFDFDGTIATDGHIPLPLIDALRRAVSNDYHLFLVTGRLFRHAPIEPLFPYLTGIVWENGAVIERCPEGHVTLPFGTLPSSMIQEMERAGIELICGMAIAATWTQYEPQMAPIMASYAHAVACEYNKGAVMILPRGANKASGLAHLLQCVGLADGRLIAFGDGENDRALLEMAHVGIAVQDAVSSLRVIADRVTTRPGPDGVLEMLPAIVQGKLDQELLQGRQSSPR